jgi:hypothetical protein
VKTILLGIFLIGFEKVDVLAAVSLNDLNGLFLTIDDLRD